MHVCIYINEINDNRELCMYVCMYVCIHIHER